MTPAGRLVAAITRLGLTAVLGLLLAEALVSWLAPQPLLVIEPGLYEADPPGRYRLSPGYRGSMTNRVEYDHEITIDERGLRTSGEGTGDHSVMVLGDSFAFGMGVTGAETFAALLGDEPEFEGLNGGLPGTGVPDMVDWYARHGRALEPDTVLLTVFTGNDLTDARPDREAIRIRDGLVVPSDTPMGPRAWLHRHLDVVRLAKSATASPALAGVRDALGMGEPWMVRNLRWEFSTYAVDPPVELVEAEAATGRALARLAAMCAEDGTRLVAALIPARLQIDAAAWEASLAQVGLDPVAHDPRHPARLFRRLLEGHGIPVLDLSPAFAAALGGDRRLYFEKDRHWTPAGHELAARELAGFLREVAGGDELRPYDAEAPGGTAL